MEAIYRLIGDRDSPQIAAVLSSTKLKMKDPEAWNVSLMSSTESPWAEALRFAERFGVLAQHLSETMELPVAEIAPFAFDFADDCDVKNLDAYDEASDMGNPHAGNAFVFGMAALATASPIGAELWSWCKRELAPEWRARFAKWERDSNYVERLSRGQVLREHTKRLEDGLSPSVLFEMYLARDAAPYEFSKMQEGEDPDPASDLRTRLKILIAQEGDIDGISESTKAEMRAYLAQRKANDADDLPTRNDRVSLEVRFNNYLEEAFNTSVGDLMQQIMNGPRDEHGVVTITQTKSLKDAVDFYLENEKLFRRDGVSKELKAQTKAYLVGALDMQKRVPEINDAWDWDGDSEVEEPTRAESRSSGKKAAEPMASGGPK